MVADRLTTDIRSLMPAPSRRDILRGLAGVGLVLGSARLPDEAEARKKRKKRKKRKQTCGKAGGKPVKGKCCKGSILVDGRCRRCDVCARGCAFSSVQDAIEAAAAGDTIAICPGTYRGNLTITQDLRLVGAGDGNGANDTIVQGSGDYSVVEVTASVVSLEHLRITGGGGIVNGGGMRIDAMAVELIGCTVSGNSIEPNGGGIFNWAGTLTLRNSTVRDNEAGSSGGGVYNRGSLILIASEIRGNVSADKGGGIDNYIDATIRADAASQITANTATSQGGGIYNNAGTVTLASSASVNGNSPNNCAGIAVSNCIG